MAESIPTSTSASTANLDDGRKIALLEDEIYKLRATVERQRLLVRELRAEVGMAKHELAVHQKPTDSGRLYQAQREIYGLNSEIAALRRDLDNADADVLKQRGEILKLRARQKDVPAAETPELLRSLISLGIANSTTCRICQAKAYWFKRLQDSKFRMILPNGQPHAHNVFEMEAIKKGFNQESAWKKARMQKRQNPAFWKSNEIND